MPGLDLAATRRKLFKEKRDQLESLLSQPLLLYWGKWDNPNIKALTLTDDFSRPAFVLCEKGRHTTAWVQAIETDNLAELGGSIDVRPYKTVDELKNGLVDKLSPYVDVAVEISDDFFGFDRLSVAYYNFLSTRVRLVSADPILIRFRGEKTLTELALMQTAAERTLRLLKAAGNMVRPGLPEGEILAFLNEGSLRLGTGTAFYPIVAAGPRSANPHPQRRTTNVIKSGDRVIIDFGLDYYGYKADITRTFIAGGRPEDDRYYEISRRLQDVVQNADLKTMTPATLAQACAAMVREAGFADYEKHGYGHGLGLETHDPYPYIAPTANVWSEKPFRNGMVFTFEPGFYDERGGFRLEEDYVVWDGRAILLQDFHAPV